MIPFSGAHNLKILNLKDVVFWQKNSFFETHKNSSFKKSLIFNAASQ